MKKGIGVVIVEDEPRVGILVKSLIQWDRMGLSCIAVASSAEDAISIIQENKPPIVITDIRMPKITGLDLIARIRELGIETRFIVISGHKDFEYARKALKYRVENYLLKPINGHELNTSLKDILNTLEDESTRLKTTRDMKRIADAGQRLIKRNIFEYIVNNRDGISISALKSLYGVNLTKSRFNVIDVKLDYRNLEDIDNEHDHRTLERTLELAESVLSETSTEVIITSDHSLHLVCLLNYTARKTPKMQKTLHRFLADVEAMLLEFERYDVTIGMGTERSKVSEVAACIDEAGKAVARRVQLGTGRLIRYESQPMVSNFDLGAILSDYTGNLSAGVGSLSPEHLQEWIESIFNEARLCARMPPGDYYRLAHVMIDDYSRELESYGAPASHQIKRRIDRLRKLIDHCGSVNQLKKQLAAGMNESLIAFRDTVMNRTNRPIRLAIEYINDNYGDKIGLESMARLASLNPAYFSVLFKNETGKNFSAYLSDVRIGKAKHKLVETNDTIAAIGKSVGYRDVRHFSRLFTRTVGIRPGLFRKLHS